MFLRFDMPTGGEPELSVLVVYQKNVLAINYGEVGDQMLWRSCWLLKAVQLGT